MVEDVEAIIRSIEDEKTAVDDRIRTRDAFARIDGLDREKASRRAHESRSLSLTSRPLFCRCLWHLHRAGFCRKSSRPGLTEHG